MPTASLQCIAFVVAMFVGGLKALFVKVRKFKAKYDRGSWLELLEVKNFRESTYGLPKNRHSSKKRVSGL